jgi:hypothetical protein
MKPSTLGGALSASLGVRPLLTKHAIKSTREELTIYPSPRGSVCSTAYHTVVWCDHTQSLSCLVTAIYICISLLALYILPTYRIHTHLIPLSSSAFSRNNTHHPLLHFSGTSAVCIYDHLPNSRQLQEHHKRR